MNLHLNRAGRLGLVWLIFFFLALPLLQAQQPEAWALKMFSKANTDRVHNFGNLALHAEAEHHFVFENIYKEDVEILSAQSNCGCTKVTVPKKVIKSGQKGEIIARVDTSGKVHFGKRKVTITVYFNRPQSAEVQLQIQAFIRSDVVFNPGNVEFGGVAQGKEVFKKVYLEYHGTQPNWTLTQVKKTDPGIKAVAKPVKNSGSGTKMYEVTVSIKESAESGYINDLIRFISNDGEDHSIFIPVHAQVLAPLSVKPTYLQLGVIHPGEEVSKNIVIRGSEPFKIEKISSTDPNMKFLTANQTSLVHVIPVTYFADSNLTGSIHQVITVKTSQSQIPDLEIDVTGFISTEPAIPNAGVTRGGAFPSENFAMENLPNEGETLVFGILNQMQEPQMLAAKTDSSNSAGLVKSSNGTVPEKKESDKKAPDVKVSNVKVSEVKAPEAKGSDMFSISPGMAEVHVKAKQIAVAKQVKKLSNAKKGILQSAEKPAATKPVQESPGPEEILSMAEQPSMRLSQISAEKMPIRRKLPAAEEPEDLAWTDEIVTADASDVINKETQVIAKKPAASSERTETASADKSEEPAEESIALADEGKPGAESAEMILESTADLMNSTAAQTAAGDLSADEGWVSVEAAPAESVEPSFIPRIPYSAQQTIAEPAPKTESSIPLHFRRPAPYPAQTAAGAGQSKTASTQFSITQPE